MSNSATNLIWIDLEMSGLDPATDVIIEIATVVTDQDLNVLAEGPEIAVHQPESVMSGMDEWNTRHHGNSGLTARVAASGFDCCDAENATLTFLRQWVEKGASPMCGNSICQDRRFMARLMPELEDYFHYRNLDVSTLKELARRWAPQVAKGVVKEGKHLALSDIRDSINELRHYREHFLNLDGADVVTGPEYPLD